MAAARSSTIGLDLGELRVSLISCTRSFDVFTLGGVTITYGRWTALLSDLVLELVGAVVAGAGGGELEALDGEGEVLVIGVVDEEAVVDGLLQALGLVALGHEGAGGAGGLAVLDAGGLAEGLVVRLDVVDHDPPLAVHVDGAPRLDVLDVGGAEVGLLGPM